MSSTAEVIRERKELFEEIYREASEAEGLVIELIKKGEIVTMLLSKEMSIEEERPEDLQKQLKQASMEFNDTYNTLAPLVTGLCAKYEAVRNEERNETIISPNANVQVQSLIVTLHKFLALDNSLIQLKKITDSVVSK